MAVLNDSLALRAAGLYAEGLTFAKISAEMAISKGSIGDLIRQGILEGRNQNEHSDEDSVVQVETEQVNSVKNVKTPPLQQEYPSFPSYPLQNPRPESFFLETAGIQKRILLTPKALMIFDLWRGGGFTGDLSDFLEDAVGFLYESRRPAERL